MRFAAIAAALAACLAPSLAAGEVDYLRDIKPLLKARCYSCHGALKQKAGLRIDTVASMRRGGDGGDVVGPGGSLLLERVTSGEKDQRMPPEGEGSVLTAEELAKLSAWIAAGAQGVANEEPEPDPRAHWAYQPPQHSSASLDALLSARLKSRGLVPQQPAPLEIWLRRVHLDLTGLPPSPEEVRAFASAGNDSVSIAKERVVERLLASPQYGERWARHFMDIWRYCDWYGLDAQLRHSQKHIWHWRDWIVESLNADKGYDRMVIEMLAVDEAAPEDRDNLRATGFLARSYYLFNRTTWLDETIEHTSRALLGVTMQCVKCHDHKYDPIEQADYYRLRAVFEPLHVRLDPWPGEIDFEKNGLPRVFDLHLDRPTYRHRRGDEKNEDQSKVLPPGVPAVLAFAEFAPSPVTLPRTASRPVLLPFAIQDHLRAAERDLAKVQADLEKDNQPAAAKTLAAAQSRLAMIRAIAAAEEAREDKALAAKAAEAEARYKLALADAELAKREDEFAKADEKKKADAEKKLKAARDALEKARKTAAAPGEKFTPLRASLKAQDGPEESRNADVQTYPESSTGRRLAFARWVADRRNPLTARVLVNHVWLRHFGAPLVADVSDFGRRSPAPLHQDALDMLAVEFMEHGWSHKHLHRLMVLSDAYARSSSNAAADPRTLTADPDNAFLWRMNPRRMESQVVRDSLLQIAGRLDLTIGGPSLDAAAAEGSPRRSLYFTQNANVENRFLATFDNANVLECYRRDESVVPQQALALTNSKLSRECADALAAKLRPLADDDFLREAFLAVLSRVPSKAEMETALAGLTALGRDSARSRGLFLQALLNHNDFVTLR